MSIQVVLTHSDEDYGAAMTPLSNKLLIALIECLGVLTKVKDESNEYHECDHGEQEPQPGVFN